MVLIPELPRNSLGTIRFRLRGSLRLSIMWPRIGLSWSKSGTARRPSFAPGLRRARAGMRLLLDENMSDRRLAARLRAQGHDPVLATDVGLLSATDARVFIAAITQALPVLTRDSEDFTDLHDLIMAAGGHHSGVLVVRFDNDPHHNLCVKRARNTSRAHWYKKSRLSVRGAFVFSNQLIGTLGSRTS